VVTAAPKVTPKPLPSAKAITQPVPMPKAEPKVLASSPPVAKPAAVPAPAPAPKPAADASGFYVQAGAFSDKARADKLAKAIGGSLSQAGRVWRVRVGPHKDRGQADAALAKVRAAGYADARVVTAP
jgi:rare lipoprotein A